MSCDIKTSNQLFDLLVIGGGINGAAIAHIASVHGLKVALLEKGDFASGTSSKSTKLIHGGLRYLENLEFSLVRESLKERFIQLKTAPHLVQPIRFLIPIYKNDRRPLWLMKFGVLLYDRLSGSYGLEKRSYLNAEQVLGLVPGIKKDGLSGGVMYSDAQMDDARLCLENVLAARENGAYVANYTEVISFLKENGKAVGVKAQDIFKKEQFEVRAKKIVCAVGPWSDSLMKKDNPQAEERIRITKGIHIVYKEKISEHALFIPARRDNRMFFIIPWLGQSLIGTTDTDYQGDLDHVEAGEEEMDYLFREASRVFPHTPFQKEKIVTTFAGLRPLVQQKGGSSKISRKHVIEQTESGLIFVLGGKYTTYRKIALDCLKRIMRFQPKDFYPVYGRGNIEQPPEQIAQEYGIPLGTVERIIERYGIRYKEIFDLMKDQEDYKEALCPNCFVLKAEVVYAIQTEMAKTVEDITLRRLSLDFLPQKDAIYRDRVAELVKEHQVF